jgi:hypothetical protein
MEIIAVAAQTVAENQNVLFTDSVTSGNCSITHRPGSGLITLRGNTTQCRARYKVSFGGNIAIPTGGTAGPISVALSIDGEPVAASTMTVTPLDLNEYNNVFGAMFIDVPKGCCMTVSVQNINNQSILVQNANLIVERVA